MIIGLDDRTRVAPRGGVIYSEFHDEEDFREVLVDFVNCLPDRAAALAEYYVSGDLVAVRTLAHQLKGSGGGYGFEKLSLAAGELEDACLTARGDLGRRRLQEAFETVTDVLLRIRA